MFRAGRLRGLAPGARPVVFRQRGRAGLGRDDENAGSTPSTLHPPATALVLPGRATTRSRARAQRRSDRAPGKRRAGLGQPGLPMAWRKRVPAGAGVPHPPTVPAGQRWHAAGGQRRATSHCPGRLWQGRCATSSPPRPELAKDLAAPKSVAARFRALAADGCAPSAYRDRPDRRLSAQARGWSGCASQTARPARQRLRGRAPAVLQTSRAAGTSSLDSSISSSYSRPSRRAL